MHKMHKMHNILNKVRKADHDAVKADVHAVMNAPNRRSVGSAAHRLADRWEPAYPKAVACLRDDLLTCFRYKTLAEQKQVRTNNAIERRFREVRLRTRPMGTFQDKSSMDRIENKSQGISTPLYLTHNSRRHLRWHRLASPFTIIYGYN